METQLAGWATHYDPASRRYFFVDSATGRSQWEDPRANDFLPPYQVNPPARLPGLPMKPPSLPVSYATATPDYSVQASSGIAIVGGGMIMSPPLTIPDTVVSEEVNGKYAKHGKKYGKYKKRRKDSWFDDSDDDKDDKHDKDTEDGKGGKGGKDDKKKKKEEDDLEFLEIVAEFM
ncbi:hypothetical protein BG000_010178 [Podila horticola]|nr:hypothetical protein BG000_010178 [Podila horticola]